MEKKFYRKMRNGASKSGKRECLAVAFCGMERIFLVSENPSVGSVNDPDFRSKSVSVWLMEEREKRGIYDIRNILEMVFGRYSPDFVPRYRRHWK